MVFLLWVAVSLFVDSFLVLLTGNLDPGRSGEGIFPPVAGTTIRNEAPDRRSGDVYLPGGTGGGMNRAPLASLCV